MRRVWQAAGSVVATLGGGGDARAARLAAAGAARAALPLLLLEHAPAAAAWEALELYPHPQVLAQACAELCAAKGWQRAVLLHEGDARGAALLSAGGPLSGGAAPALVARQLPPAHEDALLRSHQPHNRHVPLIKSVHVNGSVMYVQELAASAEEVWADELHRVVLGGVHSARAGRGAARGAAGRATRVRRAVAGPAHAGAARLQPRRRQRHR